MKNCSKCGALKSHTAFYKSSKEKSGLSCACKDCTKASTDKEAARKRAKAYYENNKERHTATVNAWKRNNRDKTALYARREYAKYPERRKQYRHKRRLKVNQYEPISKQVWQSRLYEFNNCCAYCLQAFDSLEMEHMQPLSKDGPHTIDNLIPACKSCNSKKNNKTLMQFIQDGALHLY